MLALNWGRCAKSAVVLDASACCPLTFPFDELLAAGAVGFCFAAAAALGASGAAGAFPPAGLTDAGFAALPVSPPPFLPASAS